MGVKTDKKGFDQAEKGMGSLVKVAKAAAVAFASLAIVKNIKGAITEVAALGDQFDKLSKRTGVAATQLQQLEHAAELSGASLGDVETSLRRLQAAQVDADAGLKTYTREFDRLGIEIKDVNGEFKNTPELLIEIADGMQGLESDAERTAVATKLLGRSGTALIPMFKEGSGALREMMAEMESLGGLIDDEMIQASADFVDGQRRMNVMLRSLKVTLAKEVLPWLNQAVEAMVEWWKINGDWIRQDIIRPIGKFVRVIGRSIAVLAKVVGWVIKFLVKLSPAAKALIALVAVFANWNKITKLLLSPLGKIMMVVGFLVLLFDDLNTFLEGGDSLFGRFIKTMEEWLGVPIEEGARNMIGWFGKLVNDQDSAIEDLVDGLEELGESFRYFFTEFIPTAIGDGFKSAFGEENSAIIDQWVARLQEVFQKVWDVISWPFEKLAFFIGEVFDIGLKATLENINIDINHWLNGIREKIFLFVEKIKAAFALFRGGGSLADLGRLMRADTAEAVGRVRATGGRGAGGTTQTNSTQIDVRVAASPGMNENQLAERTGRSVGGAMERQNRKAMQALTPKVSAVGI
jgi:hypothetical protein